MSGFLSTSTAMIVCNADGKKFDLEKLRANAFSTAVNPDGQRIGWVGLGDLLDTENFFLATVSGQYAGFSLRIDTKKPSGAVIKLKLAEAIRDEIAQYGKCTGKRKKELKEAITENVKAKADFVPAMIDCLWDLTNDRLMIAVGSIKAMQPITLMMQQTFGIEPEPLSPPENIGNIFATILQEGQYQLGSFTLTPNGTASLTSPDQAEEKSSVAVQNNTTAASTALADGLAIKKIQLVATTDALPDTPLDFSLDTNLAVSGLKLPKPEKGAEEDAAFIINADLCGLVARMVGKLAGV